MNVASRTRNLKALLDIRTGPGAAILPENVKRIHLDFAYKFNGGHFGPRKFWRQCLPRLKYHNPGVSMTVNRTHDQAAPAILTVYFSTSTSGPEPADTDVSARTDTIDMKNKRDDDILTQFLGLTNARPYEASPEELQQMEEVKATDIKSEKDREVQRRLKEKMFQEAQVLQQAKQAV